MRKEYTLSNSTVKKHMMHFLLMFVVAALMVAASVFLGLKRWSTSQYVWVNILCLVVAVVSVNGLAHFGGRFDGKKDAEQQGKRFLIVSAAAAVVVWLILLVLGSPAILTTLVFVADLILSVLLVKRVWETLKNFWKVLTNEVDQDGNTITYPGEYVLHEVHTSDAQTSSFGKVLIRQNAVLFVLPEMSRGFVLVHPNGTMELKKTSLIKKEEIKESNLSVGSAMLQAEEGLRRVMQLVEDICAEKNIPAPDFTYDYALFLPNFDPRNAIWDEESFEEMTGNHSWYSDREYKKYQNKAGELDYFQGKACYDTDELMQMLKIMDGQSATDVNHNDMEAIVEGIVRACGLKERESH